ncbi:MAG: fasciclin domain-containing protein [Ignavibacteria bacterium]|nr:fasciclin domain-containing protein [Ignavibacteria bacterium]MBT8383502.1 fasciclin domain-containing protein [Ignavibacteria bacterium]MBT8392322.1 fasciclin domain-containing protein [Ignavibacteria bacterium]NNJ53762.1 fasciclin domain-containing protein [Ignavibacteriaceae bacterium]
MKVLIIFLSTLLLFTINSCDKQHSDSSSNETTFENLHGQSGVVDEDSKPHILQIAINSPDHSTLVAGVQAAELENVLVNPGPLTVFAPTNAGFDKLPDGALDDLLKPENKNKLARIITSHAAPGTFDLELLKDGSKLYMATGQYLDVEVKDGDTYVDGVKILGSVDASNGIVHVIDEVFLFAAE